VHILLWSISKHGHHRQLLFLIGWFLRFWTIKKTFNFCGFVFCGLKIRNKNCMWWPCLLTDRDEMSNLHRGHFMDASYQVSVVAMIVNQAMSEFRKLVRRINTIEMNDWTYNSIFIFSRTSYILMRWWW
jgi:hypothetical protein